MGMSYPENAGVAYPKLADRVTRSRILIHLMIVTVIQGILFRQPLHAVWFIRGPLESEELLTTTMLPESGIIQVFLRAIRTILPFIPLYSITSSTWIVPS